MYPSMETNTILMKEESLAKKKKKTSVMPNKVINKLKKKKDVSMNAKL